MSETEFVDRSLDTAAGRISEVMEELHAKGWVLVAMLDGEGVARTWNFEGLTEVDINTIIGVLVKLQLQLAAME